MSVHVKAVLILLVLGLVAILGARYALPLLTDALQRQSSDAGTTKGTLSIGVDNWIGYFPLCSRVMTRRMREAGYLLRCEDDQADYRSRFRRLKSGEIQFAVATVDSYLLGGAEQDFPGTIVAVIDESKGGDALVARRQTAASLDQLRQAEDLSIAYTPASPSEYLLRAIGSHFNLPLDQYRRVETDGSSEALAKLLEGEADAAVLWEPDVSRALSDPALVKLIGTEDTERLIVDVLLVGRSFSQERPEVVRALLERYFKVQRLYRDHPDRLTEDVIESTDLSERQVAAMLRGVSWATLSENALVWLGAAGRGPFAEEGLVETIEGAVGILVDNGAIDADPLPDGDPYRITNRQFVEGLFDDLGSPGAAPQREARDFPPLDDEGWARLKEIGTLRMEPISFRSATADLDYQGKLQLDEAAERLAYYPNFRILVKGHTGLHGDPKANLDLSRERAEAVVRYLMVTYGIDPDRIRGLGFGSSRPLRRKPDESERAYGYRLPRVELSLVGEPL
jgi:outer membrane protein OmpA-like peptidoglycan-associated protein